MRNNSSDCRVPGAFVVDGETEERLEGHMGVVVREVERLVGERGVGSEVEMEKKDEVTGKEVEKLVGLGLGVDMGACVVEEGGKEWPLVDVDLGGDISAEVEKLLGKTGLVGAVNDISIKGDTKGKVEEKIVVIQLKPETAPQVEKEAEKPTSVETKKESKKDIARASLTGASQGIRDKFLELGAALGIERVGPLTRLSLGDLETGRGWSGLWEVGGGVIDSLACGCE